MKREMRKTASILSVLFVLVLSVYCSSGYFHGGNKAMASIDHEKQKDIDEIIDTEQITKGKNIFAQYEKEAEKILKKMTIEEKVGQMFLVRVPKQNQLSAIKDYKLGGLVLYARDFENKSEKSVVADIKSYQYTSKIPMFIGVDEEGGDVTRVSCFKEFRGYPFLSPQEVFKDGGWNALETDTVEKSQLLKRIGINLNFAPVCDVVTDSGAYMYSRSFGAGAQETADYVRTIVKCMNGQDIGSCLKHFPGYGNNGDTHENIVRDTRSYEEFKKSDFIPFKAGIEAEAASILVSHNIVECMDKELPASLSPNVHKILRNNLGFKGVILTDALDMSGVGNLGDSKDIIIKAVKAGNDMVITEDFKTQILAVIDAVKNEEISEKSIEESVLRILSWKLMLGIIE